MAPVNLDLRRREPRDPGTADRVETPKGAGSDLLQALSETPLSWAERAPSSRAPLPVNADPVCAPRAEVRRMGVRRSSADAPVPLEGETMRDTARCLARNFHGARRRDGVRPSDAELREQGRQFAHGEDAFALYLMLASGPAGEEELLRQLTGELPPGSAREQAHELAMILDGMRQGIREEIAAGRLPPAQIGPEQAGLAMMILALSGNAESARRAVEAAFNDPAARSNRPMAVASDATRAKLRSILDTWRSSPPPPAPARSPEDGRSDSDPSSGGSPAKTA